jgi:ferredoxin
MLEILTKICDGQGTLSDLDQLADLAEQVKTTSLCALGQTAPNPVLTTLRYFEDEYREHIVDKRCRAGKCPNLSTYEISDVCTGCMVCKKKCPVDAISGKKKEKHIIDQSLCIRCGACRDACKYDAVLVI